MILPGNYLRFHPNSSKSAALGEEIEESKIVKKFLKSLPRKKYIQIVASLEQVLDLKTTSFEDIIGRLKAYEECVSDEEEESQDDQGKLMFTNNESQASQSNNNYNNNYNDNYRGRGRGGRFPYRGRGRGRYNEYRYNEVRDASRITCYRCDKIGQFAADCPDKLLKLQEAQEDESKDTQEADELMMHQIVYLNKGGIVPSNYDVNNEAESTWYLDNGASNHVSGDKRYFSYIDDSVTGKVRFDDDSRIDIKGNGTI